MNDETLKLGLVSVSDRASGGVYEDKGIPALRDWCSAALSSPWVGVERLIPDDQATIERTLIELCDEQGCQLLLTSGGTGPAPRDLTPEATMAVADRLMPGFGEQMRAISLAFVPTAILSRQLAAQRGKCLVVNLPGSPRSIDLCLDSIMAAVPYCLELMGAAWIDTDPRYIQAFRPKK